MSCSAATKGFSNERSWCISSSCLVDDSMAKPAKHLQTSKMLWLCGLRMMLSCCLYSLFSMVNNTFIIAQKIKETINNISACLALQGTSQRHGSYSTNQPRGNWEEVGHLAFTECILLHYILNARNCVGLALHVLFCRRLRKDHWHEHSPTNVFIKMHLLSGKLHSLRLDWRQFQERIK